MVQFSGGRSVLTSRQRANSNAMVSGMFSYAIGLNHGRYEGERAAQTIRTVMMAGPIAATDWATLMTNNDPAPALAECKKNISTDE